MKIHLIAPPHLYDKAKSSGGINPPMGLMYLSSFLKKNGHNVTLLDCALEAPGKINNAGKFLYRGLEFDEIISRIDKNTDLIGISNLFSCAFPLVSELCAAIKNKFDIPIVLGGANATALSSFVLRDKNIDFVVLGEGEFVILNLCKYFQGEKKLQEIDGLAYKKENGIVINEKKEYISNLDELPFPDREFTDIKKYYDIEEAHGATRFLWTPIITSRGCPFVCTFCTSSLWANKWRARSAKNVVDEIEYCVKKLGIKEFLFEDENFTLDKNRVLEICDEIIERNLDIAWQTPNGIRASVTNESTLLKMKKSGCYSIVLAPESGSERVLEEIMNKQQDLSKVVTLAKYAKEIGLLVTIYLMMGLPGEKKEDLQFTVDFANKLAKIGVDEVVVSPFNPLPGSVLFEKILKIGKYQLNNDLLLSLFATSDLSKAKSWSEYLLDEDITNFKRKAFAQFHIYKAIYHPIRTLKSVYNICLGRQEIRTERAIKSYLKRYIVSSFR